VEFRLLGELEVWDEGTRLPLRGAVPRSVLAYLLLHANEGVSVGRLVDELWGSAAPPSAAKMVQNAVSQLRKAIGSSRLVTRPGGYVLELEPDELDARRFERLVEDAREALAAGSPHEAERALETAAGLWRGPPLADLASASFAQLEISRLEEARMEATECGLEVGLALGRHAELVGELEALVARHPLRETLRQQLMLALYRSGRQAEALAAYQAARRYLSDEVGIEPSAALQRLERAILLQDPSLELEVPEPTATTAAATHARRKTLTVLHAELTRHRGSLDPEALRALNAEVEQSLVAVVQEHGGTVSTAPGGALQAVFGLPTVGETDTLRAVRAAVDAREALAQLNERLEQEWGVRLSMRIGVGTGEALVEPAGTGVGAATGDVFAHAAQLAHAARDGEVLVAQATHETLREGVETEPVGELELAGEVQVAWRLIDVDADATVFRRRLDLPFVGRDWELGQLHAALERATNGQTSYLVTILGPAGIGKSRLAQEFASSVGGDATVLVAHCLLHRVGATFFPLAEIVRAAAGDTSRDAIAALVAGEADADQIADRIAGAIGAAEPAGSAAELFWAVRKLFDVLARERPLVLVFEDIHWAEPTLLDLLDHLVDATRGAPVLLLCLTRSELLDTRPTWGGGKLNAAAILLEPLSPDDAQRVIGQMSGGGLAAETAARIAEAAEGNPLFLEQMVAMALEAGPLAEVAVPATIHALLAARIDRLDPRERAVLERASVLGKEFDRAGVIELTPAEECASVEPALEALSRRELIGRAGDERYRFRHGLIRDVAYDGLPKAERAALHEACARQLEQTPEHEEILGFHLERAHQYRAELDPADPELRALAERAAEVLAAAGRRAYARDDIPAAVSLLTRAAALHEPHDGARLELLAELGEAVRESGDYARAEAVLAEAIQSADEAGDEARLEYARLVRLRMRVQTDPALTADDIVAGAQRAIDFFSEPGDDRALGKAWELLAWGSWLRCQAAATEEALQRSLEHAGRAGDTRTTAQSLHLLLGATLFGPLPVSEGIARCEEILADRRGQKRVTASALRALAALKAMAGEFDESRALLRRFASIVDDLGLRVTAASAAETYAVVELLAGDPRAAERELRLGYERLERMGETSTSVNLAALLAQALHAQGDDAEAVAVTEVVPADDDVSAQVHLRAARAKALASVGRLEEAEALGRDAVARASTTDFLVMCADALSDLAEVLRRARRPSEAAALAEEALDLYVRKGNVVSARKVQDVLTTLAL
jgi:DNA-binding SARP family transcriptional activator